MGWTSETAYQRLNAELATSSDRGFERLVLPLLHIIWPATVAAPPLRSLDRAGIDHLAWADVSPFPLVVQCKGFQVSEEELGRSQIEQCRKSVLDFRASGHQAETYLLVHNRFGKEKAFRERIEDELAVLESSGQVRHAELWNRPKLLLEAFNHLSRHMQRYLQARAEDLQRAEAHAATAGLPPEWQTQALDPLEQIPLRLIRMHVDQYQLRNMTPAVEKVADPVEEILGSDHGNLTLLLGEFGLGKTTTALRALGTTRRRILYVPAATISARTENTADLLKQCIQAEDFLGDFPVEDWPLLERMARPVIQRLLTDPSLPMAFVLDGLDESAFLSRTNGLQHLFNCLRSVKVPIVLTARTEFWNARRLDFETSFGLVSLSGKGTNKHLRINQVELLPWTPEEIGALIRRYQGSLSHSQAHDHLEQLVALVESGRYNVLYGDIPCRPLFLRWLIELSAVQGIGHTRRVRLFHDWAVMKIQRDIQNPHIAGGEGRMTLLPEDMGLEVVVELVFAAMEAAAVQMTRPQGVVLELLPSCPMMPILSADRRLERILDPTGLFLNSLLMPEARRAPGTPLKVRFAHRVYQELFLARALVKQPLLFGDAVPPEDVGEWAQALKDEGML